MCSTTFPRNPLRTTSLKTTFRLPFNDSKWRRSPAISRSGGEVESSRCYTRRSEWDSPNRPGSGKWTSNSLAPTFRVIGPALRTSTAKPTTFTAGCALGPAQRKLSRNNGEHILAPGYACVPRAEWLRRYRDTVLPKGAHVWYKTTTGCGGLEKSTRVRLRIGYTWSEFWTTRG